MAESVTFFVKDSPERKTYPARNRLQKNGFHWNANKHAWQITIPKREVNQYLNRYGQQLRFSVSTDEPEFCKKSSKSYRKTFLKAYPDIQTYHCVYCGKKLNFQSQGSRQFTIDHIVSERSVNGSPNTLENRKRAAKHHITDINSVDNLVPACAHCNQHKAGYYDLKKIGWAIFCRNLLRHKEKLKRQSQNQAPKQQNIKSSAKQRKRDP